MDIKSFYPSIDPKRAEEVAKIMWKRSSLKLENVDLDLLAKYVGKFCEADKILEENLTDFVYLKKKKESTKKPHKKRSSQSELANLDLIAKNVRKFPKPKINKKNTRVTHMDQNSMSEEASSDLNAQNVRKLIEAEEVAEFVNKKKLKKVTKKTTRKTHRVNTVTKSKKTKEQIEKENWANP